MREIKRDGWDVVLAAAAIWCLVMVGLMALYVARSLAEGAELCP